MEDRGAFFVTVFLVFFSLPAVAQTGTIPLLVTEHHADHMEFFFRYGTNTSAAMIVLDAHTDTVINEQKKLIRNLVAAGVFSRAGELTGNHNWIHPLAPSPLESLVWISAIRGSPRSDKLQGFWNSLSRWDEKIHTAFVSVEELRFLNMAGETLFVSVDLDFFYSEDHAPEDVPAVLDALFSFSSSWPGPSVWAVCLSRPWLPDDRYAWNLLERCLNWLCSRQEFRKPEMRLFDSRRIDSSLTAQAIRAEGREVPFLREADTPEYIKKLIEELLRRD